MADEIVSLRVNITGATEAQITRLERLDRVMESLQRRSAVDLNLGDSTRAADAERAAEAAAQEIAARERGTRQEMQRLTELQGMRDSIAQAEQRRLQEETRQLQEQQQKVRQGFQIIGSYLYREMVQNIQKATQELKAMNAEMVSIQKVTGATDAEMKRLKESAFDVAGDLGSTPSDYLASVTKWAQAGYGALSDQLGELSAKTQVVGDVNEQTANKFLLAVDAAYKYKGNIDSLTRVLDGANEISNNYATSVDKLANGMGIVSSLAEQAGMKVEETMAAIGTITAKTQEGGASAARALRALILNIQGSTEIEIDAETGERWTEDEIQRTAAALGKLNVATREYKDGIMQLRNPMEVIGELSEKYHKGLVTEAQLQDVVASLGGKVRSNQLMALIQGYDTYLEMIETYKDSVGSADQELEIYLNGWEAKSNKLVAQWTEFVERFKASDISMLLLDTGSALLKIAETPVGKILAVTAAVTALNAAMKSERGAAVLSALGSIPQGLKGIIGGIAEEAKKGAENLTGFRAAIGAAAGGAKGLWDALYAGLGPLGMIAVALTAAAALYETFGRNAAKAADALAQAKNEYEQSAAELEQLQDKLKTTQERIDELNSKGSLITVVEQEELDRLNRENEALERQIVIQEKLNEVKKAALDDAAREALDAGYSEADLSFFDRVKAAFTPKNKENILATIQGKSFEEAAGDLAAQLDKLNEKKEKFLTDHPDASTWTESQQSYLESLDRQLEDWGNVASGVYQKMQENAQNLTDDELREYWEEVAEALYEAMFPAEAMTEQLNRLVEAMDEAEQTQFHEFLRQIQEDGEVTVQEVEALLDKFPVLKQLLDINGISLQTLAQFFTEVANAAPGTAEGIEQTGNAADGATPSVEDYAEALGEAASKMKALTSAQEELEKNGVLSIETLISLMGNYGDELDNVILRYMAGTASQKEMMAALQAAHINEAEVYKQIVMDKIMTNEAFYRDWLSKNQSTAARLREEYGVDATQFKTFEQLKQAASGATRIQVESDAQNAAATVVTEAQNASAGVQSATAQMGSQFAATMADMSNKASIAAGFIKGMLSGVVSSAAGAISKIKEAAGAAKSASGTSSSSGSSQKLSHAGVMAQERAQMKDSSSSGSSAGSSGGNEILNDILKELQNGISVSNLSPSSSSGGGGGGRGSSSHASSSASKQSESAGEPQFTAVSGPPGSTSSGSSSSSGSYYSDAGGSLPTEAEREANAAAIIKGQGLSEKTEKEFLAIDRITGGQLIGDKRLGAHYGASGYGYSTSGSSSGTQNPYQAELERLEKLKKTVLDTNRILERSDKDTSEQRLKNIRELQEKVDKARKDFLAKGLAETSDEVQSVTLMYHELGDEITAIYSGMTSDLLGEHDKLIWAFEMKDKNIRTPEQMARDDADMVEQYRQMQKDVHDLAEFYRAQGVRENDELIRNLQEQWWEYEDAIRTIYDNLSDAFFDYIDESGFKLKELSRATGTVGEQLDLYTRRLQTAYKTMAALQAHNIGGANNGAIQKIQEQIWGDKDAVKSLQEGIWAELEQAMDSILDGAKEDVAAIEKQMDEINDILDQYDRELDGILKPINKTLEALNKELEQERKRLAEQTDPLNDRVQWLRDEINGYFILNPNGSMGDYVKGLDDDIGEIQEQIDQVQDQLDQVNDAWNEQKKREDEALALQKKQLAAEEAQKAVQDALLALQTARNERNIYTLKDGVWAWRADQAAIDQAEKALADAEKAREEAEKDLQDYKEEQAHNQIVKRLQEQIKALEEQKELLNRQKDLINKEIEALNKQITAFERESSARQELIQKLIDQNEAEKEAWEEHYGQMKEEYQEQLDLLEEQKKAAEDRYDQWESAWEDIRKSLETPARDISEILSDIAKYGTPAMSQQVNRVTDLLRNLGHAIEDLNYSYGYGENDGYDPDLSRREIIDRMLLNTRAWAGADPERQRELAEENRRLGDLIGAVYDAKSGRWDIFDYSGPNGQVVTVKPGAYEDDWGAYGSGYTPVPAYSLDDVEGDGWRQRKEENHILTSADYAPAPQSLDGTPPAPAASYYDDHSITINGMRVGQSMMEKPLSQVLGLIPINMGD